MAEETPRSDGHEAEDEGGGEEAEEEEAERKGSGGSSSTLSRELIHSTVEQALQVRGEGSIGKGSMIRDQACLVEDQRSYLMEAIRSTINFLWRDQTLESPGPVADSWERDC